MHLTAQSLGTQITYESEPGHNENRRQALRSTAVRTVRDLLFGGVSVEPTDALAESLREHGTVKTLVTGFTGLTAAAGRAVEREVATVADDLLSPNLLDLAVAGWNRYEALTDAARRTRDAPTA